MKKYYRLSIGESWNDGESWSVNQWYYQPYVIETNDKSDCKSIVKSLKVAGLLKNNLRYNGFNLDYTWDESEIFIDRYYIKNVEPLQLRLIKIDEADLESELNSHYGIQRRPTILCKA